MDEYYAVGQLEGVTNGTISGWARSEDRPGERLVVEILADDTVIATGRANRFRADLSGNALFDGQHAFAFGPPDVTIPPGTQFVSAREKGTGRVFARVRCGRPRHFPDETRRLDRLERELALIRDSLAPGSPPGRMDARVRATFAALGRRLSVHGPLPEGEAARIERLAASLSCAPDARPVLTPDARPVLTIVLLADCVPEVADLLATANALFAGGGHEVIVVNRPNDPSLAGLAAALPGTAVLDRPHRQGFAETMIRADAMARGSHLAVFDATFADGASDGRRLPRQAAPAIPVSRERLVIGPSVDVVQGRAVGAAPARTLAADNAAGLLMAVERVLFRQLGGLDPALDATPPGAVAAFGLKAAVCGIAPLHLVAGRRHDDEPARSLP